MGEARRSSGTSLASGPTFVATFAVVFVAMAALFVIDTFLARMEQTEGRSEAVRLFDEGQQLAKQGRNIEAVEHFRSALSLARGNREYQLALAKSLLDAGNPEDAEATLRDVLQRTPTDGPANLAMARVLVKENRVAEATSYYHRAIYGQWKEDPHGNRVRVRFELVDLLARQDARQELLAELLPLEDAAPDNDETRKRIGRLFIVAGSPARASEVFRSILRRHPQDAGAYLGLGEAEFARGNYRTAQTDFTMALRLKPDDEEIRTRLDLCNEVLALDPMRRGLAQSEQYRRSVKLVSLTLEQLTPCAGSSPDASLSDLMDKANQALKRRVSAWRQGEALETNLDLAEQLWQARRTACKEPLKPADEPLALVISKLAQ